MSKVLNSFRTEASTFSTDLSHRPLTFRKKIFYSDRRCKKHYMDVKDIMFRETALF